MPLHEYVLQTTKDKFEVIHSFNTTVSTWGELAEILVVDVGNTSADTLLSRILGGRIFMNENLENL